jgi:lipopolysaccharide assembly outer membrane protein LptD (OstA)
MKRFLLFIALMACLPAFAQDQPKGVPSNNFTVYRIRSTYIIKAFEDELIVTSRSLEWVDRASCVLRLSGVEVATKGVILQADEVDYHCRTGEIEARGNVLLKPFPQ